MNINRIIISGNLVADPTLRETNSGTPVASATIANNEFFNDGDGERQQVTTFADVTVWAKSGESFASLAPARNCSLGLHSTDKARLSRWPS